MKIDSGLPLQNTLEIGRAQKKSAPRGEASTSDGVTSQLSSDAVLLSSLESQANSVPDVRQAKVADLQSQIKAGTYEVSDQALASAILRDVLRS